MRFGAIRTPVAGSTTKICGAYGFYRRAETLKHERLSRESYNIIHHPTRRGFREAASRPEPAFTSVFREGGIEANSSLEEEMVFDPCPPVQF